MSARKFPDDFVPAPKRRDDAQVSDSEIIAMAWCDDTSFDSIKAQTGLSEPEVIALMQRSIKPSSFRLWRKRASGRAAKHDARINPKAR